MARSNIRGITVEIDGNTSKLSTALRDVNKEARNTNNALKDIQKSMNLDPKNSTELLKQKHRELGNAIKNTKEKLEILKKAQSQMTDEFKSTDEGKRAYDNLTREILATENQLKSLEKQVKKSNQVIRSISDTSMEVSKKTGELGKSLTGKLTAPIVAAGGVVTKFATDFDTAMVGVSKTVDMTDSEFQEMKQSIRNMAKEMPASAVEIANVAEAAGQLGIQKEHILDFSKTMIDLGETTNLTADEAATAFAKFANITQMPQTEFANLGSVVVDLGNNLATTEADIVQLGTRLAASGTQAGLTEAEIMGLAGAMSSVGINAEAGGTAMSQVLQKIGKSVSLQDENLQTFAKTAGMTAEEFSNAWKTKPREALQSLIEGLKKAGDNGENVDLILTELGITGIRETDTLKRLAGSGDLLGDSFDMANKAFEENNALSEEAQKKYESFGGKLEIFKNKTKDVAITIGDTLMPHIEKAVDKIGELADSFSKLDPSVVSAGLAFAGFLAVLGPLLLIISKVAAMIGTVSGAIGLMTGAITTGTPAMIGLSKIFGGLGTVLGLVKAKFIAVVGVLGGPLTIAIGAVIGLIILMATHWEETKAIVGSVVDFITEKWQVFADWFSNIWTGVKEAWSEFWDGLGAWFGEKWNAATEELMPHLETFKNIFIVLWKTIEEIFSFAWELITEGLKNSWEFISGMAELMWEAIKAIILKVWDPIEKKITEVWNNIKNVLSTVWEGISSLAETVFGSIKNRITQAWDSVKTATIEKWDAIKGYLSPHWDNLKTKASQTFEGIRSVVTQKWDNIKASTNEKWNSIKGNLNQVWDGMKSSSSHKFESIKTTISGKWNAVKSNTSSTWNSINSQVGQSMDSMKSRVSNIANGIKSNLTGTWNSIKSTTSSIWNGVKNAISNPINRAKDAVSSAVNRMKSILNISLPTPRLKLPHPRVSGKFSLDPPQVPSFSIDWYKKGAIFTKPTLFNTPFGMKGVGEAGAEAVLPIEKLSGIVAEALRMNQKPEPTPTGVTITGNTFNVREESDIEKIARELYRLMEAKKRGVGLG